MTLPAELVPTSNWLGSFFGTGLVRESFSGAWQRNVTDAMHPSILAFSAVYSCVSIISSDLAKLPLRIMRTMPNGGREPHLRHPISGVVWKPNHFQTRVDFIQQFAVSFLLTGNAYAWKERDDRGVVSALYVLDPRNVVPLIADTGDVFYRIKRNKLAGMGTGSDSVTVPASEIIHHRMMCLEHPLVGVTPLYAAGVSAQVGAQIINGSTAFFGNQARPAGVLVAPGRISKETAALLKTKWEENFTQGGMGRTAVLGDGLKWEPLTMTASDAQLIEQLRWSVEDVARVFRVPVFLLGDLSKVTYRNSEQMARHYYSGCLQYHIEALESRFDDAFGLAEDVFIEFDLDALLRTDSDVRFKSWQTAIQSGFKTINEVRKAEGDAPIKGGDEPLIQVQYMPLSQLGKKETAPAPSAPAPSEDDNEEPVSGDASTQEQEAAFDVPQLAALFDDAIARAFTLGMR